MIHSFSAADPSNPGTIAGRWLAQGAFLFYGAMDEPYLPSFRLPALSADLLAAGLPVAAALRPTRGEPFGQPWKLVLLGDPLYTIRRTEATRGAAPRVSVRAEWVVYMLSEPARRPTRPSRPGSPGRSTRPCSIRPRRTADPSDRILAGAPLRRPRAAGGDAPAGLDDLRAVLEYQARQYDELRDVGRGRRARPADGRRRPGWRSRARSSSSSRPWPARTSSRARRLWADCSAPTSTATSRRSSPAGSARSPTRSSRREAWRVRLRAASSRLGEKLGPAIIGDELRGVESAIEGERSRAPR